MFPDEHAHQNLEVYFNENDFDGSGSEFAPGDEDDDEDENEEPADMDLDPDEAPVARGTKKTTEKKKKKGVVMREEVNKVALEATFRPAITPEANKRKADLGPG